MGTFRALRFEQVRLANFRNIDFVDLPLESDKVFFLGRNAQGKSNLLEGLGLVTALKSFRTNDLKPLIRSGQAEAATWYQVFYQGNPGAVEARTTVEIRLQAQGGKQIYDGGEPLKRIRDLLGRYPTVLLASEDIQLLRGGPGERRRWIDLLLSVTDPEYFRALVDYHRCLTERNRLLKQGASAGVFDAFEHTLAGPAVALTRKRREALVDISSHFEQCYATISEGKDGVDILPRPETGEEDAENYANSLAQWRERDRILGTTRHGPHRDDIELRIGKQPAKAYGSDGQQRSIVLALRLAQARHIQQTLQCGPVILADDIIGELDSGRRAGFWKVVSEKSLQVIATGTEPPRDEHEWVVWNVNGGKFTRHDES